MENKLAEIKVTYSTKVKASDRLTITSSEDAEKIFRGLFSNIMEHKETVYALFLNRSNKVLGYFMVSIGGVSGCLIDPRIVFQTALKANASSFILAHNHPSGNLVVSEPDIKITTKLVEGGKYLDIQMIDHLILSEEGYLSMADEGIFGI